MFECLTCATASVVRMERDSLQTLILVPNCIIHPVSTTGRPFFESFLYPAVDKHGSISNQRKGGLHRIPKIYFHFEGLRLYRFISMTQNKVNTKIMIVHDLLNVRKCYNLVFYMIKTHCVYNIFPAS